MAKKKPLASPVKDPRALLASAFINLASREGAYRITLERVAKEAGIPFSSAHRHLKATGLSLIEFGLREVTVQGKAFTDRYLERAAQMNPEANPLHQYIEATFEWARVNRPFATLWLFHYHLISVERKERQGYQPFLDGAIGRIEKLIYESIGRGFYHPREDKGAPSAKELAAILHAFLLGTLTRSLVSFGDESIDQHEAFAIKAVDRTFFRV